MYALWHPTATVRPTLSLLAGAVCSIALIGAVPSMALAARPLGPLTAGASSPFAAFGQSPVRDAVLGTQGAIKAGAALSRITVRGGTVYTPAGEPVKIYVTTSYTFGRSVIQTYANFLGSLWHSREITSLTMYVLTPVEIGPVCGYFNLACYVPSRNVLVVPGEALPGQSSLQTTIAHEYAHHIANHRSNDPWRAIAWGPKRWATYMNVCRLVSLHRAFPGDEGAHYASNPGEGWAVGYAYSNGYGWFSIVDAYWKPSLAGMAIIKQDSVRPWSGDASRILVGRLQPHGRLRTTVSTPLDGSLHLRLAAPIGALFRLRLYAGGRLVKSPPRAGRSQAIDYTVCGARQVTVTISAMRGSGKYTLTVKRP